MNNIEYRKFTRPTGHDDTGLNSENSVEENPEIPIEITEICFDNTQRDDTGLKKSEI